MDKNLNFQCNFNDHSIRFQLFFKHKYYNALRSGYLRENYYNSTWGEYVKKLLEFQTNDFKEYVPMHNAIQYKYTEDGYKDILKKKAVIGHSSCKENALMQYCIILDYDGNDSWEAVKQRINAFEYLMYSSFNNKNDPEIEKFRVVLPLLKPVPAAEIQRKKSIIDKIFLCDDTSTYANSRRFHMWSGKYPQCEYSFGETKLFDMSIVPEPTPHEFTRTNMTYIDNINHNEIFSNYHNLTQPLGYHQTLYLVSYAKFTLGIDLQNVIIAMKNLNYSISTSLNGTNIERELISIYNRSTKPPRHEIIQNIFLSSGINFQDPQQKSVRQKNGLIRIEKGSNNRETLRTVQNEIKQAITNWYNYDEYTLLAHEPGTHKTRLTFEFLLNKKQKGEEIKIDYFAFSKNNQDEIKEYLFDKFGENEVNIIKGRDEFCTHPIHEISFDDTHSDYNVAKKIDPSRYCNDNCPFVSTCNYVKQFQSTKQINVRNHAFLFNYSSKFDTQLSHTPTHIIIDESPQTNFVKNYFYKNFDILRKLPSRTSNTITLMQTLIREQNSTLSGSELLFLLKNSRFNIEDELNELYDDLNDIDAENHAFYTAMPKESDSQSITEWTNFFNIHSKPKSSKITNALINLLTEHNENINIYLNKYGIEFIYLDHIANRWKKAPILYIDATPYQKIIEDIIKHTFKRYDMKVKWSNRCTITQVYDKNFTKTKLLKKDDKDRIKAIKFIQNRIKINENKTKNITTIGIITFKTLEEEIEPLFRKNKNVVLGHFGGNKGSNKFNNCDELIILGQYLENGNSIHHKAEIIFDDVIQLKQQNFKNYHKYKTRKRHWYQNAKYHREYDDTRLHEIQKLSTEYEMVQSIGRIRPIDKTKDKKVWILSDRGFNIPIDKLTQFKDLGIEEEFEALDELIINKTQLTLTQIQQWFQNECNYNKTEAERKTIDYRKQTPFKVKRINKVWLISIK